MSSWLRGRRLLAEPGFSMPGLLRRGKLLSARAAYSTQEGSYQWLETFPFARVLVRCHAYLSGQYSPTHPGQNFCPTSQLP